MRVTVAKPRVARRRLVPLIGTIVWVAVLLVPSGLFAHAAGASVDPIRSTFHLAVTPRSAMGCPSSECRPSAPAAPMVPPPPAAAWKNLTPVLAGSPPAREGASLVYDAADGYLLLFGGLTPLGSLRDTWKFQNGSWTNLTPTLVASPGPRYKAGIAYDAQDGYVVLFGGKGGGLYLNDTWTFRAGSWTHLPTAVAPSIREDVAMTYDPVDRYVVLFGGETNPNNLTLSDTWSFSGGVWQNLTSTITATPPPRETGGFTFDAADGYALLFGGKRSTGNLLHDTWSYVSGIWTNHTTQAGPPPTAREASHLAYDAADRLVLLFGGFRFPSTTNDSWVYQNTVWTQLTTSPAPSPRFDAPMEFVPQGTSGFVLLFGGRSSPAANGTDLSDTWSFKVPLSARLSAQPTTLDLSQTTRLTLNISGGFPPFAVTWFGLPSGCGAGASPLACTPSLPGIYTVTAQVNDSVGSGVTTSPVVLNVHPLPTAQVSASPLTGIAPLTVKVVANVTPGVPPYTFNWTWGDGTFGSLANTTHAYLGAGNYTPTLRVTDEVGGTVTSSTALIVVSRTLSASATASPTSGPAPLPVHFRGSAAGGLGPYNYTWTFGDRPGSVKTAEANYTYKSNGNFTATLTVKDSRGKSASTSVVITVTKPLAVGLQTLVTRYFCEGTQGFAVLNLSATAVGGTAPYTYNWTVAGILAIGPFDNLTVHSGGVTNVTVLATDAAQVNATASSNVDTVALACANTSGATSLTSNILFWVLVVLILAVIAFEAVMVFRRRRGQ